MAREGDERERGDEGSGECQGAAGIKISGGNTPRDDGLWAGGGGGNYFSGFLGGMVWDWVGGMVIQRTGTGKKSMYCPRGELAVFREESTYQIEFAGAQKCYLIYVNLWNNQKLIENDWDIRRIANAMFYLDSNKCVGSVGQVAVAPYL